MVAITGAIASLGAGITASLRFTENSLVAYILVLSFVLLDAGASAFLSVQGVSGVLFTTAFNALGVPIVWYSWHVLIILAIAPIVKYCFFD